ncbi:hypothetical protein HN51_030340 [Arachis hypogaea]
MVGRRGRQPLHWRLDSRAICERVEVSEEASVYTPDTSPHQVQPVKSQVNVLRGALLGFTKKTLPYLHQPPSTLCILIALLILVGDIDRESGCQGSWFNT